MSCSQWKAMQNLKPALDSEVSEQKESSSYFKRLESPAGSSVSTLYIDGCESESTTSSQSADRTPKLEGQLSEEEQPRIFWPATPQSTPPNSPRSMQAPTPPDCLGPNQKGQLSEEEQPRIFWPATPESTPPNSPRRMKAFYPGEADQLHPSWPKGKMRKRPKASGSSPTNHMHEVAPEDISDSDIENVKRAIESLYEDKLKPECKIVQRRLQELFNVDKEKWNQCWLRAVAEKGDLWIAEEPEKTGALFSIFLSKEKPYYIDPKKRDDGNSWARRLDSVISWVRETGWCEERKCTTSNYELAKFFRDENICGLSQYFSLGEIHQLVHQLIEEKHVGHRKVENEWCKVVYLVPYHRSDENNKLKGAIVNGNWEELGQRIGTLLRDDKKGDGLLLSTFKRRYQQKFSQELKETNFHCLKLAELLGDPRLHSVCRVEATGTETRLKASLKHEHATEKIGAETIELMGYLTPSVACSSSCAWADPRHNSLSPNYLVVMVLTPLLNRPPCIDQLS